MQRREALSQKQSSSKRERKGQERERWRVGWREWREEEWRVWGGRGIHTLIMSANCFIEAQNSAENELMSASFFFFQGVAVSHALQYPRDEYKPSFALLVDLCMKK